MKDQFHFDSRDVHVDSQIDIHVWRKSDSKRKGKKRQLTASASLSLGELLKRQSDSKQAEIRLNCMNLAGKRTARGQPQKCATIFVHIRAPSSRLFASTSASPYVSEDEHHYSNASGLMSETVISEDETHPLVPISDEPPSNYLRRRRIKAYKINSDDDSDGSFSVEDEYQMEEYPIIDDDDSSFLDNGTWDGESQEFDELTKRVHLGPISWIAMQVLPRYIDQPSASQSLSRIERFVDCFSPYRQMFDATTDDEFKMVLENLKAEWAWVTNISLALCGLNAAVFSISSDSAFQVDPEAKNAAAVSSVSASLGVISSIWYQVLYRGTSGARFKTQARDTFGTYFFFCLCCRLPSFLILLSTIFLLAFITIISYDVWPQAVLVVSFFAGLLLTMQYLLFGAKQIFNGIRWLFKKIGTGFARAINVVKRKEKKPAEQESLPPPYEVRDSPAVGDDKKEKGDGVVVTVELHTGDSKGDDDKC